VARARSGQVVFAEHGELRRVAADHATCRVP
jgi:hypothetical protein